VKQTQVRKRQRQLIADLHEHAWAETDIFMRVTDLAPRRHDYHTRLSFEWGF
jgi:hypothetical protein